MKVAIIAPMHMLHKFCITDYHMALTHLVLEPYNHEYRAFYRGRQHQEGQYVILDNSVVELGNAATIDKVLAAADAIKANEIILPDVLFNCDETVRSIDNAIDKVIDHPVKYKIMAVPQGKNDSEWLRCYQYIIRNYPEVTAIGIPKHLGTAKGHRVDLLRIIQDVALDSGKAHHLLGMSGNPTEVSMANAFPWIRGIDSGLPVQYGLMGRMFTETGLQGNESRPVIGKQFFEMSSTDNETAIYHNIGKTLSWANF